MVEFSPRATRPIRQLIEYYEFVERPEAVLNLAKTLRQVESKLSDGSAIGRSYPAVYRELASKGRFWIHVGSDWIAYRVQPSPRVVAVVWDKADIAARIGS